MKQEIHLREYGRSLAIELTSEQYDALAHYRELITIKGGQKFRTYYLEAGSWIGHILLPQLKIVIEPKIGAVDVLNMIIGGDGEANPKDLDAIVKSDSTFWDVIAEGLICEVFKLIQSGLRHKFIAEVDSLTSPRGKIEFYADFIANTPVRKGIVCEYDEFSPATPENIAIKWGLEVLEQLVSSEKSGRLRQVISHLNSIPYAATLPHFTMPSSNDPYFRSLWLVRLIDRATALKLNRYGFRSAGFGVDMNKVFEGYVRNQLRIAARRFSLRVTDKARAKQDLCAEVRLEPDILITQSGIPIIVADCKYKVDWANINSDIYQMLAYLEGYQPVNTAVIFCPSSGGFEERTIDLPRDRKLVIMSLPVSGLFDSLMWDQIILRLEKKFNGAVTKVAG